jgi:hypothetical protein
MVRRDRTALPNGALRRTLACRRSLCIGFASRLGLALRRRALLVGLRRATRRFRVRGTARLVSLRFVPCGLGLLLVIAPIFVHDDQRRGCRGTEEDEIARGSGTVRSRRCANEQHRDHGGYERGNDSSQRRVHQKTSP